MPVNFVDVEDNVLSRFIDRAVAPAIAPWLEETWQGQEHVPDRGGVVVAANHLSHSDPLVIGRFLIEGAGRFPHFLGKAEIFATPVFGRLIRHAGQIPVHRGTARAADSFVEAVSALEEGELVCLLPEGTLTRDPDLWPMAGKTGAARLALTTGCPLVPVAMWGPERILPPNAGLLSHIPRIVTHRHEVSVTAGEPLDLEDLRGRPLDAATLAEATSRLMDVITDLLAQIRGEAAPVHRIENPRIVSRSVRSVPRKSRGVRR